ncbi:hypothetical protein QF023_002385 [Chryseobacterium sp. SLBN-27]|uniref:hypothetical protein n=1 Tax=Chryseobacterium sp. SLBN-27 TaxID=3042287 RepID=UPI0028553DE5|nr:hypothetical protein [Chryseobacterium sp. SLBN-27]MDR6158869.1 hypothetical protein [Chryseobacterium sp. SLBN-27]
MEIDKYSQVTGLKILIQSIPYIGTPLNEILFEHRGRIKQDRLNKFLQNLKDYFDSVREVSINESYINSEEFGDIFESIIEKVTATQSEEKVKRFKQILLKQIEIPEKREYIESFLDIVSKITDKQFEILIKQNDYTKEYINLLEKIERIDISEDNPNGFAYHINSHERQELINKSENLFQEFQLSTNYGLEKNEYLFLIQDLISKSLLYDAGVGRFDVKPFEIVLITDYGSSFVKYISEK